MTTGKIPMLGFKAAAIKFVTLFGFGVGEEVVGEPLPIPMTGSLTPLVMSGSMLAAMTGSVAIPGMTGSVGD